MANLLVVDTEKAIREMLEIAFRKDGHRVEVADSLEDARRRLTSAIYEVIITASRIHEESGVSVLRYAKEVHDDVKVIVTAVSASVDEVVQALNAGAFAYVVKSANLVAELRQSVWRATMSEGNERHTSRRTVRRNIEQILGESPGVDLLRRLVITVAPTDSSILLMGEGGTGKELVARAIHGCSLRHDGPFVSVNCVAFDEAGLEEELFGHVKGASRGASDKSPGAFESAKGGTLFLDEIGEISMVTQVKLARVLEQQSICPPGRPVETPVDVRLIAATDRNLEQAVRDRTFRQDLYYRAGVIPMEIPPLRARTEDIPLLATHFMREFSKRMGKRIAEISPEALNLLQSYSWPGNVRELESIIERAVAMERGEQIGPRSLPDKLRNPQVPLVTERGFPPEGINFEEHIAAVERSCLQTALRQAGGVRTRAAELLGISYRSFRHYSKKYGF